MMRGNVTLCHYNAFGDDDVVNSMLDDALTTTTEDNWAALHDYSPDQIIAAKTFIDDALKSWEESRAAVQQQDAELQQCRRNEDAEDVVLSTELDEMISKLNPEQRLIFDMVQDHVVRGEQLQLIATGNTLFLFYISYKCVYRTRRHWEKLCCQNRCKVLARDTTY